LARGEEGELRRKEEEINLGFLGSKWKRKCNRLVNVTNIEY
jgi:hypothetical protein